MQWVPYSRKYREKQTEQSFFSTKKIRKTYTFFNSLPHRNKHKKKRKGAVLHVANCSFSFVYIFLRMNVYLPSRCCQSGCSLLYIPTNYHISRCSKLFYIILSKYFYFALRSCTAFVCPALSHIARYAPLLRQVRLHLSIALESKLSSLCIRFALTFAQNKQLRHNNAIQM